VRWDAYDSKDPGVPVLDRCGRCGATYSGGGFSRLVPWETHCHRYQKDAAYRDDVNEASNTKFDNAPVTFDKEDVYTFDEGCLETRRRVTVLNDAELRKVAQVSPAMKLKNLPNHIMSVPSEFSNAMEDVYVFRYEPRLWMYREAHWVMRSGSRKNNLAHNANDQLWKGQSAAFFESKLSERGAGRKVDTATDAFANKGLKSLRESLGDLLGDSTKGSALYLGLFRGDEQCLNLIASSPARAVKDSEVNQQPEVSDDDATTIERTPLDISPAQSAPALETPSKKIFTAASLEDEPPSSSRRRTSGSRPESVSGMSRQSAGGGSGGMSDHSADDDVGNSGESDCDEPAGDHL
jgi:hypothetical protein